MRIISGKTLAKVIEADLLREPERKQYHAPECHTCGRSYLYKPPKGDDSGAFCSARCRDGYDAGAPAWDKSKELDLRTWTPKLAGLRTVAGPPGTVGLNPWQSVIDASERKRRNIEIRKNRRKTRAIAKASKGEIVPLGNDLIREKQIRLVQSISVGRGFLCAD
jgi:hypothetical protein